MVKQMVRRLIAVIVLKNFNKPRLHCLINKTCTVCKCNSETRSCDHCGSGKAIGVTYSECVFVCCNRTDRTRFYFGGTRTHE